MYVSNSDEQRTVYLQGQERKWFFGVQSYISLLRTLKVAGPLSVSFAMFGIKGCYMKPTDSHRFRIDYRQMEGDEIIWEQSVIPENVDGGSIEPILNALKKSFVTVWREAGVAADPSFDFDGKLKANS